MTKQILPEPKITRVKRSPDPNTALSQNWIEANREKLLKPNEVNTIL